MTKQIKKIAIIGSRKYTNELRIRKFIIWLITQYGANDIEIISGEQKYGADGFAKKMALEFGVKYISFPPEHYNWNPYCKKEKFNYNKPYKPSNFFKRNQEIIDYSDIIFAFIPPDIKISDSKGTYDAILKAKKINKPVIVMR